MEYPPSFVGTINPWKQAYSPGCLCGGRARPWLGHPNAILAPATRKTVTTGAKQTTGWSRNSYVKICGRHVCVSKATDAKCRPTFWQSTDPSPPINRHPHHTHLPFDTCCGPPSLLPWRWRPQVPVRSAECQIHSPKPRLES